MPCAMSGSTEVGVEVGGTQVRREVEGCVCVWEGETNIFTIVTASIPLFMWVLSYNWVRTWLFHR